ncbi:helix-turn-helix domain-containing protein [Corallococcus macrosporus]|uniref:Transcriptional regulator n=1 Tax=Myxococcus fulvus (strain ATCC BAA-855 / HW-1) TaxID=483219 RepID=F8CQR6_MYXFH|nr:ATP-binding protein [Corallococcus macrosporus]AEI67980.1 transcriptional regulator [Corallococcus macrosporus]
MKNPWEWTEEDLLDLVKNQVQESLTLDYKASKALERTEKVKDEITKDVSALANSAGGTLVYGIPENKQTRLADKLDEGVDPAVITREWLDQVINSNIQRRIDGVRINQIPLMTASPGRVAYVIHVPQSIRAPHQARDRLFYKRFEYHSKPMEEYEIRDVARRQEEPDLRVRFQLDFSEHAAVESGVALWRVVLVNKSSIPCDEAVVELQVESGFKLRQRGPLNVSHYATVDGEKGTIPVVVCRLFWSAKGGISTFDGCPVAVSPQAFSVDHNQLRDGQYLIRWKVSAPRTTPREAWTYYRLFRSGTSTEYGFWHEDLTEEQALALPGIRWFKNEVVNAEWC